MKSNTEQHDSLSVQKEYEKKRWNHLDDGELEEILACLEDSDRYLHEGQKDRLIREIKSQLHERGHLQY